MYFPNHTIDIILHSIVNDYNVVMGLWGWGGGGEMIHEKNQKQRISWHCPFKTPPKTQANLKKPREIK